MISMSALAAILSGCPQPAERLTSERFIEIGEAPNKEPTVSTNANGTVEVIYPTHIVSAVGHAKFYNNENIPRYVSIGGSGTKYFGEAYDNDADGVFETVSKKRSSQGYSISDLERVLQQVSVAIQAGKESTVLK